jgi:hypothetical protein
MSYEFALLPVQKVKEPSFFSSLFSKKEAVKPSVVVTAPEDASTPRRRLKGSTDYVSLFQSRSENGGFAYYENNSKKPAFSASKDKVTVHKLDDKAIRAGLQLAQNQFGDVRVDGPDDVRRQVWLQGQAIGIDVKGYEPTEKDRVAAEKLHKSADAPARATAQISAASEAMNSVSASPAPEEPAATPQQPDVLVEHGAAPYEFDEKKKMNYYVTVREASGDHKTHWGVDLERAIGEAGAETGDQISFERLGRKKVKVTDPETKAVREVERQTWQVDVLEKAAVVARQEAISAARNVIGADAQIYQARTANGASVGSIVYINERYVVQQIGDKSSAIIHDITQLSGSASAGQRANIVYNDGIGNVEVLAKEPAAPAPVIDIDETEPEDDYEYE